MSEPFGPTPYDEVNHVLRELLAGVRAILGEQFLGLYLYGSLALGDFDPGHSDIDFLVVTDGELSAAKFQALRTLHDHFAQSGSPWAGRIEAAYVPLAALNHPAPTSDRYPQIEKGTQLIRAPLEIGWAFQRHTLRQQGVAVSGPAPGEVIEPVDPVDMRRAATAIVGEWWEQSQSDAGWIAWARERGCLAFVVLTLCRLLYSLETGRVASKPAAARWAAQSLGPRWAALIERALAGQHAPGEASDSELEEMLAFLDYVYDRARE